MRKFRSRKKIEGSDTKIILWSLVLTGFIFVLEWELPSGAISGMLFVLVIIWSLLLAKRRYTIYFAVVTTLLIGLDILLALPENETWQVVSDRLLAIFSVWITTAIIVEYKQIQKTRSDLAAIVDSSEDAIIGKTLEGRILSWNKGAETLLGYTAEEIVGQSVNRLIPDEKKTEERELLDDVKKGRRIQQYETLRRHKEGYSISVSLTLSPIKDSFGNIRGISSIVRDITDRIQSEEKLKILNRNVLLEKQKLEEVLSIEEHLNVIFDINRLVDFIVYQTTKMLDAGKCSLMFVDHDSKELYIRGHHGIDYRFVQGSKLKIGESVAGLVAQEGRAVLVTDIESDQRYLRRNRPSYQGKSFISAPIKLGNQVMGVINVSDKISKQTDVFSELDLKILNMIVRQGAVAMENAKLYRELKHLTVTDPLTQIHNYRHFAKSLDLEIIRFRRYRRPLCLLMIDIDDFKSYNDTFGHLEGDVLLKQISRVFNQNIRKVDIACRYAGDEFVIILPETNASEARVVAEKIKKAVEKISLKRVITVSVGIAKCSQDMNRYEFIQRADMALLEAKKQGKNKVYSLGRSSGLEGKRDTKEQAKQE